MQDLGAIIDEFVAAMAAAGVNMDRGSRGGPHPIPDGRIHRADALGKKQKRNSHVWYILHADGVPAGAFGDLAAGIEDTWTAKRPSSMTADERKALKKRMEETARARAEAQAALNVAAAQASASIMAATVKADPAHPYLARKGLPVFAGLRQLAADVKYTVDPDEPPRTAKAGVLVVPVFSPAREQVGVQMIAADGTKRFIKGMAKEGNYHAIGKPPTDGAPVLIAEGYATAARLHEATGFLCIAAFDSGNLASVSVAIRAKFPKAVLVIAADNDRMTTKPVDNPGLTKAREAAEKVGALVAWPVFDEGDITSTDFDDLARVRGLDAVREAIDRTINPPPPVPDVPEYDGPPPDYVPGMDGPDFGQDPEDDGPHPLDDFGAPHFRCLGVDGMTCFFQPANVAQVIELPIAGLKGGAMFRLAPAQWWELEFAGKQGTDWNAASNATVQACLRRGKFVAINTVRGRGAWFEGDSAIFHHGDGLIVNGARKRIHQHKSRFVYDEGEPLDVDTDDPASLADARRLLTLCKSLRWQSPLSGYLLAGWLVTAPVCGFLKWRPHIWINGPAGSGKTAVMEYIVNGVLGGSSIAVKGNTTEAGIRAELGMDALPVVFDEAEPKDQAAQARLRAILDLARVAASESDGSILKGSSGQKTKGYRARSMFCFASINTQIEGFADESRFTQLTLTKPEAETDEAKAEQAKQWERLLSDILGLITPAFSRRLLARTILNLPTLRHYVDVFTTAATLHLGAQRLGDQIGPMLAGAYLLNTTKPVTLEDALAWIRSNNWTDHTAKDAAQDNERFVQMLMGHTIRHQTPEGGTWERPIGELLGIAAYDDDYWTNAAGHYEKNKRKESAIVALAQIGFKVNGPEGGEGWTVEVTNTHEKFRALLRGTEWAGTAWKKIFQALPGAQRGLKNRYFCQGVNTPYTVVPLDTLIGDGR